MIGNYLYCTLLPPQFFFGYVVAMTNLYWYYAKRVKEISEGNRSSEFIVRIGEDSERIGR